MKLSLIIITFILLIILVLFVACILKYFSCSLAISSMFTGGNSTSVPDDAIHVMGNGLKLESVLFIPGLGNGHESFNWDEIDDETIQKTGWKRNNGIQKPISQYTKTLSFDPPGIRESEGSDPPKTYEEYCYIIKNIVKNSGLKKPFIIVAHSAGCLVSLVYQKLYPDDVSSMIFLDPTPDFIPNDMEKPDYYTKRGGKYEVTRKYIEMLSKSRTQLPKEIPTNIIYVHYNTEDSDPRKDEQKEFIERVYLKSNITNHKNESHFMHVTNPESIVQDILKHLHPTEKYLYHGSNARVIDYLEPRPSNTINGESAVFATNEKWLALVFIPKHTGADLEIGIADGIAYIGEMYEGAFNKLKSKGYIYKVSSENFHSDYRLGLKHNEFINPKKVKILETEVIDDVLSELKTMSVTFIPHDALRQFQADHKIPTD